MFASKKINELSKSEISGILRAKLVAENSAWVSRDPFYAYVG